MTNPKDTAASSFGVSPVVDSCGIARTTAVEEDAASDADVQVQQQEEEPKDEEQVNFSSILQDIAGSSEASMPIPTMANHEMHESGIATEPLAASTAATGTDSSAVRDNNVGSGPNVDLTTSQQVSSQPKEFQQGLKCTPEDRTNPTSDWTPPPRATTTTSDPHGFRSTMSASRARKRAIELQVSQSATTRLAHSPPTVDSSNRTLPRDDDRSSCTMGSSVSSYLSVASLQRQVRNLNNLLSTPLDSHLGDLAVDPESGRWDESTRSIVSEWNNLARAESMMRLELENAEAQMEMDMTDLFAPPVGAFGQSFRRRDDTRFSLLGIQPIEEENSCLEDDTIRPSQSGPKSSEVKDAFAAVGGQEDANRCTATEPRGTAPRPRLGELPETLPPLEHSQTTAPKSRAVAAAPRDGLHCRGSSRYSLMTGGSISSFSGSSLQLSDAIRQQFHDIDHLLTSPLESRLGDLASRSEIERNQSTHSIVSEWNKLAQTESMMRLELENAQAQMEMDMKDSSAPPVGPFGQSFRRRDDTRFSLLGIQPIEEEISGLEDVPIHPTKSGPKSSEVKAAFMSGGGKEDANSCTATEPQGMTPRPSPAVVPETPPLSVTLPPAPDEGSIAELPKLTPEDMTKLLYLKLLMGALLIGVLTLVVGISVGVRDGMGPKENLEMNGTANPSMLLEEVKCNTSTYSFQSQVFSNVEIDPTNTSRNQILEQAFMDSYNNLAFLTCDGLFRSITEVKSMFHHANRSSSHQDSRRLQQDANTTVSHHHNSSSDLINSTSIGAGASSGFEVNSTDDPLQDLVATFFSVKGECRGCEVSSSGTFNLFDDAFNGRRRLQTLEVSKQSFLSPSNNNLEFSADPSTCVCLAGMTPSTIGNGPTIEAFGEALAKEIALLDQHGESEFAEPSVGNLREGNQVACSGDVQDFTTYVYADFTMEDGHLTDVIKHRMESAFMKTYNDLSFQACDEFFRVVSRVGLVLSYELNLDKEQNDRRLVTNKTSSFGNYNETQDLDTRKAYFQVMGRCRNCPVMAGGFALFDDAYASRRRRSLTKESSVDHSPSQWLPFLGSGSTLREALDVCLCPQGKSPGQEPSPSTQEFLDDFNANLAKAQEEEAKTEQEEQKEEEGGTPASDSVGLSDGTIFVQPSVGKIREGMQVTCSGEIQDFTAYVYADFNMEDVQVTDGVKKRMESVFLETYNDLTFQVCDGFFRVITEVELVIPDQFDGSAGDRRQLKVGVNATYNYNARAHFKVTGRCRNCPVSTSGSFALFDEAFRRHRSLQGKRLSPPSPSSLSLVRRRMQEALDLCLCPHGKEPGNEPPPSPEEFLVEFNDNAIKAQEEEEKAKLLEEAEEDRVQEESAGTATQASVVPVLLIQKLVSPELPSVSNMTSFLPPSPTTAEPTPLATDNGILRPVLLPTNGQTHQATQGPTFEPAARPIPQPPSLPTSNATTAPNGTALGPSKPTPLAAMNVSSTPIPQPLPNLTSNATSMSYPGHMVTSCNETLQEMDEFVDLTISGSNATQVENSFLIDAFMNASDQMQSLPGCFPTILNARIQTRGPQRLRRRLQLTSSSTLTVVFSLVVSQVNQGDFHQPWHQRPFETALSQILMSYGLTLQRFGTVRGDPLQTPQASMQPTHNPLASVASETMQPSPQPTYEPTPVPSITFTLATSVDISQPLQILQPSMPPTLDQTENTQPPSTVPPSAFAITEQADAGFLLTTGSETLQPSPQPTFQPTTAPSFAFTLGTSVDITQPPQILQPSMPPTLDQTETSQAPTTGPLNAFTTTQQAAAGFFRTTQPTPSSSSKATAPPRSSPTPAPTAQPTPLPTFEPTTHATLAPTAIPTPLPTFEPTPQPTPEPTLEPTLEPTPEPTPQPTTLPTFAPSPQPTPAPTPQPTPDPTPAPVLTLPPVANPTATLPPVITTAQPVTSAPTTQTPTIAPSTSAPTSGAPTANAPSTGGPTVTPVSPSVIPSHTPTASPSILPSGSPSSSSSSSFPSKGPSHTASASPSIPPSGSPSSSSSPSSFPSASPSIPPSGLPSSSGPSSSPSKSPSPTPSACPSILPSRLSSSCPSSFPSEVPSLAPSASPSILPSGSSEPSFSPSAAPSSNLKSPSSAPSQSHTLVPSKHPSDAPSAAPSMNPSDIPSTGPSSSPSFSPSISLSDRPSAKPSSHPSGVPSNSRSFTPSTMPSAGPSSQPSSSPSDVPSRLPSEAPSTSPSACPSFLPSLSPPDDPSRLPSVMTSVTPSEPPSTSSAPSDVPSTAPSAAPSHPPSAIPSPVPSSVPSFHFFETRDELDAAISAGDWTSSPYGPIETWDVSRIADFSILGLPNDFNQDISNWDVGSATTMSQMFGRASAFNQPLSGWDVSKVTDFFSMFAGMLIFNQDISSWDVGSATTMDQMFLSSNSFNQPLSGWDVSKVTSFRSMFLFTSFNQDISSWDVGSARTMEQMFGGMFSGARAFNQPLSGWDVSKVTDFARMFQVSNAFNQDISSWDVGSATVLDSMFDGASAFNQDLCTWGTHLFGSGASVSFMFISSGCPSTSSPQLAESPVSPLCHVCVSSSMSPSVVPPRSPSVMPSDVPTHLPSTHPSVWPSGLPSTNPSGTPSLVPSHTSSQLPSVTPSLSPSSLPSRSQTSASPSSSPSGVASDAPSDHPSVVLTSSSSSPPSDQPASSPSSQPSDLPTSGQSSTPSASPLSMPSSAPSRSPTSCPSIHPSSAPSQSPTTCPSKNPSQKPSSVPSGLPSTHPSVWPSGLPSTNPTGAPSLRPSHGPSQLPSVTPSLSPSSLPSSSPSGFPSGTPSDVPSLAPSDAPSQFPSTPPSNMPSLLPSGIPSMMPSHAPSGAPSPSPTDDIVITAISLYEATDGNPATHLRDLWCRGQGTGCDPKSGVINIAGNQDGNELAIRVKTSNEPGVGESTNQDVQFIEHNTALEAAGVSATASCRFGNTGVATNEHTDSRAPYTLRGDPVAGSVYRSSCSLAFVGTYTLNVAVMERTGGFVWDSQDLTLTIMTSELPPTNAPSDLPSASPSDIPSSLPTNPVIDDKVELMAAIDSWITSGGTDTTFGPTINDWDVTRVSDFSNLFDGRSTFNDPINGWQTSQVTNMHRMFAFGSFNQPLNAWDVSNVANFGSMFQSSPFNQDISSWDVGSATDMQQMFASAGFFDQPLNAWDVSRVTNFAFLFAGASSFNQNINSWNVGSANDMQQMFASAGSFNQPLTDWDVLKVTNFAFLFTGASSFNQDLCSWDTHLSGSGADVTDMFVASGCPSTSDPNLAASPVSPLCHYCPFNSKAELSTAIDNWISSRDTAFGPTINDWDVSRVSDFSGLFQSKSTFNDPINSWTTSQVTSMIGMFHQATSFNQPLNNWDVSGVVDFVSMFQSSPFNQDISSWDVGSATSLSRMFNAASEFNQDLCFWGNQIFGSGADVTDMFVNSGCPSTSDPDLAAIPVSPLCFVC